MSNTNKGHIKHTNKNEKKNASPNISRKDVARGSVGNNRHEKKRVSSLKQPNFVIGSQGDQWVKFRMGGCPVLGRFPAPPPSPPLLSRTTRGVAEVELQSRTVHT